MIKDTYKYNLKKDGVLILRSVTNDLDRRVTEHQVRYSGSIVEQVGNKVTRVSALKWLHKTERHVDG